MRPVRATGVRAAYGTSFTVPNEPATPVWPRPLAVLLDSPARPPSPAVLVANGITNVLVVPQVGATALMLFA